jgi:tetratricopeptide (TPR) repeat protein
MEAVEWQERCLDHLETVEQGVSLSLRCAFAANLCWLGHGDHPARGEALSHELVAEAQELGDPLLLGRAYSSLSISKTSTWDLEAAIDSARLARRAFAEAGDEWGRGWSAFGEGWSYRLQAKVDEATALFDEAIPHLRRAGDKSTLAWALSAQGIMARYQLRFDDEVRMMQEAGELFRDQGNRGGIEFTSVCTGISLTHLGRYDEALARMEYGHRLNREQSLPGSDAELLGLLVWVSHLAGDRDRLRQYLPETFESTGRTEDPVQLAQNLEFLAPLLLDAGHADRVGRIIGYSDHHRALSGRSTPPPNIEEWKALLAGVDDAIGEGLDAEKQAGASMDFDQALAFGLEGVALVLD